MSLSVADLRNLESNMQEDIRWKGENVSDMCDTTGHVLEGTFADLWYHDKNYWGNVTS